MSADPLWAAAPLEPREPGGRPVIESIEGDKIVVVKTPNNGSKVGERGTEIDFGDRIKTGPRASAKIRYPDGSKLLIGRATEMEVQESKGGAQFNELKSGEVRGIISRPKIPTKTPRFIIRSKSAVMGVRGTDFVMNLDDEAAKTQLHTLDGAVEVAPDEPTLMEGKGVRIEKDQTLSAENGKISQPTRFDRRLYEKMMEEAQPEFVALTKNDLEIAEHNKSETKAPDGLTASAKSSRRGFRLLQFGLSSIYLRQKSGGEVMSGQASWNPTLHLLGLLALRGHIAFSVLKGRTQNDKFVATQVGLIAGLELLSPLLVEAGLGSESWGEHGSSTPYGMANVALRLSDTAFIERIFVGASVRERSVSTTTLSENAVITVRAGVGVQF